MATQSNFPANGRISVAAIVQALIVAAIVATASGLAAALTIDVKVGYLIQELKRVDVEGKETRNKSDEIGLRQARAISQANEIHDGQNRRIERLENRK